MRDKEMLECTKICNNFQRDGSSQWLVGLGPLALPMLFAITPLAEYNLRTSLAVAVFAFVLWFKFGGKLYYNSNNNNSSSSSKHRHHHHRRHSHSHHHHHVRQPHKQRPIVRGQERHCEDCDETLLQQLCADAKPVVSWSVRTVRRMPLRYIQYY